ncbi:hypothetical protein O0I10_007758 [Lichtheimia ornata]|uniref:Coronin n=1 Tax=Lichtheimia ornata TaxID=688661 RepID=A0AAD7XVX6_9FUNG|nr:uncharacterized protein O0I10_007758 [Lichtheimia ornata]KAJ8656435.1 hypothetical protein O0I10_007758 [Lichtheimia ornata]
MRYQPVNKYRNAVSRVAPKEHWYPDLQLATSSDSARLIQANNNCIAVKWTGNGGSIGLLPLDKTGKGCANETRVFQAHGGASITDWEFSPFHENLLATGAEDGMIKLWDISTVSDNNQPACVSTISLPSRKVASLGFHPTADNIVSTLGNEGKSLCIWDIQSSDQPSLDIKNTSPNPFQSFSWKSDGRLVSTIAKSSLTLWDPRASEAQLSSGVGHEGIKGSRVVWLGESNYLFTVGQSKFRSREYAVWDARNMAKPFKKTTLDTSSGIMLPLYDQDTETMYLVSRGDATIHTIQFSDLATTPSLAENQPCGTTASIYGATLLPKTSLRVMETEIARILAVVDNGVMPVSFHVPRKQYIDFHGDLYPDTNGDEPGVTGQDWLAGKDGQVPKVSLRPGQQQQQQPQQPSQSNTTTTASPAPASTASAPAPAPAAPTSVPPTTQEKADDSSNIQKNDTKPETTTTTAAKPDMADKAPETPSQPSNVKPKVLPKYGAAKMNSFKYLYGKMIHPTYDDLRDLSIDKAGISELIQASADFIAVPIAGAGGRVGIIQQVEKPSRLPTHLPCVVCGSPVTYFVFDPFDSHKLITASEDSVIRFWKLSYEDKDDPVFDLVKSIKDPSMDKISHILPHPNAQGVLLSASNDLDSAVVRIWDVENEEAKVKFTVTASPLSAAWSPDGNKVAIHSKDKQLQIYDARSGTLIGKTKSHDGIRPSRIMWMDDHRLVSVGFGAGSMREVLVYDINQFEKHIAKKMLDVSPSVMSAHYDPDCKILYVAGRGDRIIHTISINDKELESLSPVECGSLQQGFAFLPKRLCKVDQVEIARFFRLTPTSIERHGIRVPRARPEFFQDDIFIDTADVEHPSQNASSWFDGVDTPLSKISLKPDQMTALSDAPPPQHAHANNHAKQLMDITTTHEHRENAMDAMFASAKNVDDDDHQKMKHATTSKEDEEVAEDEWDD